MFDPETERTMSLQGWTFSPDWAGCWRTEAGLTAYVRPDGGWNVQASGHIVPLIDGQASTVAKAVIETQGVIEDMREPLHMDPNMRLQDAQNMAVEMHDKRHRRLAYHARGK